MLTPVEDAVHGFHWLTFSLAPKKIWGGLKDGNNKRAKIQIGLNNKGAYLVQIKETPTEALVN